MDEDLSLRPYVELLEILLLGYAVFHILDGGGGQPGAVPYMIDRRVPSDCIQPGAKGASARIPRLFDDQAEEGLLRQLLGEENAADIAVQEEDQPVLVFSDDLGDPFVVTVKETALATGTVIH